MLNPYKKSICIRVFVNWDYFSNLIKSVLPSHTRLLDDTKLNDAEY